MALEKSNPRRPCVTSGEFGVSTTLPHDITPIHSVPLSSTYFAVTSARYFHFVRAAAVVNVAELVFDRTFHFDAMQSVLRERHVEPRIERRELHPVGDVRGGVADVRAAARERRVAHRLCERRVAEIVD